MNSNQRFEDLSTKVCCIVIYCFSVLIVTGYIGTYTLGLLMSTDAETGFDPSMIFNMIFGAFVIAIFGWPLLLAAAFMYTILFPLIARMSLRFFGPALPVVFLIALLQAMYLSKQIGDFQGAFKIFILTIAITLPTHLLTLIFGNTYNRKKPVKE